MIFETMRLLPLFLAIGILCSDEVNVHLRNPVYKNGIVSTSEGGVIQNNDIRIQAMNINSHFSNSEVLCIAFYLL